MKLNEDMVWCLRALTQDAPDQRSLYPDFVLVADELVCDFHEALQAQGSDILELHSDIAALDALIISKSGQLQYWLDPALEETAFWAEIRTHAREILSARDLSTSLPTERPNEPLYIVLRPNLVERLLTWAKQRLWPKR